MRHLTPEEAARFRRRHTALVFLPLIVVSVTFFVALLAADGQAVNPVLVILALVAFGTSLAAPMLYRRWLMRLIDPDPDIRKKVMRVYLFSIGSSFLAVGELLDQSVLRGGGVPLWYQKQKKPSGGSAV